MVMLPEVELDDLLGWVPLEYVDGQLPDEECRVLLDIVRWRRPRKVLEIGTYMGATTRRLAETVGRWDGVIVTVDLPDRVGMELAWSDHHLIKRRAVGREFRGQPCAKWIVQVLCDTAEWDFKEACGAEVIFIDGSHTYECCRNDSEKSLGVAAAEVVMIWHDCDATHPGVMRLLGEWREAGRDIQKIKGTRLAIWV